MHRRHQVIRKPDKNKTYGCFKCGQHRHPDTGLYRRTSGVLQFFCVDCPAPEPVPEKIERGYRCFNCGKQLAKEEGSYEQSSCVYEFMCHACAGYE